MEAQKLESVYDLVNILKYSEKEAQNSTQLYNKIKPDYSLDMFQRQLRQLAHEARVSGHPVISGPTGYYKAVSKEEWERYKLKRFSAIKDELISIAGCDHISVKDLIKYVYAVNVDDQNYMLNL